MRQVPTDIFKCDNNLTDHLASLLTVDDGVHPCGLPGVGEARPRGCVDVEHQAQGVGLLQTRALTQRLTCSVGNMLGQTSPREIILLVLYIYPNPDIRPTMGQRN